MSRYHDPSERPLVLVVDDDPGARASLRALLDRQGNYQLRMETSGRRALARIDRSVDVVVTERSLADGDGMAILRRARQISEEIQVVIVTAQPSVDSAVEAMKLGAFEYLVEPVSAQGLVRTVEEAIGVNAPQRRNRWLRARLRAEGRLGGLVGQSERMQRLFFMIERAAASDATVLITGESGTGKELIARAIHDRGGRREGPFVAVNCAAIAESLLESELFGHERGAFTGAVRTKTGSLERADGGTLFLDEIGEMSAGLQAKLLRALESQAFRRVGGTAERTVDVRFVAATNIDLPKAIADGGFREDLYFRLNVVSLPVPPLRDRLGDVPLLVEHFLEQAAERDDGLRYRLDDEALELLLQYPFPGNVRELQNLIERARLLATGTTIRAQDLPLAQQQARPQVDGLLPSVANGWPALQAMVKELERGLLLRALAVYPDRSNGEIAALLGTSRRVFELRLREHGLNKPKLHRTARLNDVDRG